MRVRTGHFNLAENHILHKSVIDGQTAQAAITKAIDPAVADMRDHTLASGNRETGKRGAHNLQTVVPQTSEANSPVDAPDRFGHLAPDIFRDQPVFTLYYVLVTTIQGVTCQAAGKNPARMTTFIHNRPFNFLFEGPADLPKPVLAFNVLFKPFKFFPGYFTRGVSSFQDIHWTFLCRTCPVTVLSHLFENKID
jgi:hypothetical protein